MLDLVASTSLLVLLTIGAIAYAVKYSLDGPSRSARVQAAGSSALLREGPMQAAYWVLTPLGRRLAARGVSANAITFTSLVFGAAAGGALAIGHFGVGALLAGISTLGDALDGIVARESGTASDAGEVFDAAVDRYTEFLFLAGLAVFYRESVVALSLVLFAILGSFMVSYSTAKAEALAIAAPRGAMRRAERAVYLTLGAALVPIVALWNAGYASAPLAAAVGLVAMVANASAAQRFDRLANLVRARDLAPVSERRVTAVASSSIPAGPASNVTAAVAGGPTDAGSEHGSVVR